MEERTLYKESPSMFRNNPIGFILGLIIPGLGWAALLIWWLKSKNIKLTVTDRRVILETGLLSKHINEVYHADVRNVQIKQEIFQRIFGVGSLLIATAGHGDSEIEVKGIPDPRKVRDLIDQNRGK